MTVGNTTFTITRQDAVYTHVAVTTPGYTTEFTKFKTSAESFDEFVAMYQGE